MISTQALRTLFLNYFKEKGHAIVASSSLIPTESDKSLLFVNAGMVPFKEQFSGHEPILHRNATSAQRCLRAGGKHNDLDNVGYTARHHTLFEMLGNFSFGDYFKREAIQLAWNFLTQHLKLPPEKLWITVYQEDQEAADIWLKEIKVDPERFSYCGKADNFWAMGDTGPCGPCSEIFYDHGFKVAGGPPGSPDADGDRYVEIWNLVFMQYERKSDGTLVSLPNPCVDTGMGLERMAAVMQNVVSNYDIDIFKVLTQAAEQQLPKNHTASSHTLKVIADHIRAIGFLIADGIAPNNEGQGYVLRRIIRRALRHGYQAGAKEPFLYRLIPTVVDQMQDAYPLLQNQQERIVQLLLEEEKQFLKTLHNGLQYFEKIVRDVKDNTLSGQLVFKLYDTYGFPPDLTAELARERQLTWDEAAFKGEMDLQRKRSQSAGKFLPREIEAINIASDFTGYTTLNQLSCVVGLLDQNNQSVQILEKGEKGSIILNKTPFYAEAGGQIGDQGELYSEVEHKKSSSFTVLDTQKNHRAYLHHGYVNAGCIKVGDQLNSQVDDKKRQAIKKNHSATHLLHAALHEILGKEATQKGSLVSSDYLRFDFNYLAPLAKDLVQRIEQRVNQAIWANFPVTTNIMSLEKAKENQVTALFDTKYDQTVRVLSIGDFSKELCGGTHVDYTGEIGCFLIIAASSIASGTKRIEAITGEAAFNWIQRLRQRENDLSTLLKSKPEQLIARAEKQILLTKQQASSITELKQYISRSLAHHLAKRMIKKGPINLISALIPSFLDNHRRELSDQIKSVLPQGAVIVLGSQQAESIQISISVSKQYTSLISADALVKKISPVLSGKGGGRSEFAQVRATGDKQKLLAAMKALKHFLFSEDCNASSSIPII